MVITLSLLSIKPALVRVLKLLVSIHLDLDVIDNPLYFSLQNASFVTEILLFHRKNKESSRVEKDEESVC